MASPTTRGALKRTAAKGLGAYFTAVMTVDTATPAVTLTVPQIADVAFDAERFQSWYVQRKDPPAVTISTSSAADPTLITTTTAHFLAPGDIILIAGHTLATRNGTFTVLTTPSATTFTIDVSSAGAGGTSGTLTIVSQYRIITSTGLPAALTITLQRAFQGVPTSNLLAGTELEFFLILSPIEWDDATNSAVQSKFYKDRISIPLVSGQKQYDQTDAAKTYYSPWFQSRGQFIRGRYRDSSTATAPFEDEIAALWFTEVAYGVKLIFPNLPSSVTNITAEIEARHYYSALTSDADTVTLPERLAVSAIKDEALKLIFQKLGPAAKKIYGMAMVLTERELAEQEARWLDNSARRDYSDEEAIDVGDLDMGSWGW